MLILESEFIRVLTIGEWSSTMFPKLNQLFDCDDVIQGKKRNDPMQASRPHVSVLGMCVKDQAFKRIGPELQASGFANRFLWIATQRDHDEAIPVAVDWKQYSQLREEVLKVSEYVEFMHQKLGLPPGSEIHMVFSEEAERIWREYYPKVLNQKEDLLARGEAYLLRLGMMYAIFDLDNVIQARHLRAAIAVWEYSVRSVEWIWGTKANSEDPFVQPTYDYFLARGPIGANKREVNEYVFNNNYPHARVDSVITTLIRYGKIEEMPPPLIRKRGKPTIRYKVVSS
jgi:hypothetical protein